MNLEGVIKFHVEHETGVCCSGSDIVELTKWRTKLRAAGLVGQDFSRYGGLGFGNLSKRMRDGTFLITASQTGHLETLTPEGYARITDFDPTQNMVWSKGVNHPSSETMTHLAAYGANRRIQFVFHAHCSEIWNAKDEFGLPTTDPSIEYGTVEMFYEVLWLLRDRKNYHRGILAMGGHTDGLLAWGETADETGFNLLSLLSRTAHLVS
ncbi:MAG TPA: class II aldolase/adducin family protein [Candidatus Saccharimonadales bacterium]|nr:class II aldolase/adducin family protein [Candidatus Saccharimonadales bacterium]